MPLYLVTTTYDRHNGVPGAKIVSAPYATKAVELSGWVPQEAKATPIAESAAGVLHEFNTAPAPEIDEDEDESDDTDDE